MGNVIAISPSALEAVVGARNDEQDSEKLALWIEVTGQDGDSFIYDVYFEELSDATEDDAMVIEGGVPFVVPKASIENLQGATLDFDPEGGLVLVNPNAPKRHNVPEFPPAARESELAQRVIAVLADEINPSIAAHGGRADLVGVVENVAYLQLSGGCQGCGLAAVTLSQGISVAIRESIPEISDVVDVTDHASGDNPFFAGAKK